MRIVKKILKWTGILCLVFVGTIVIAALLEGRGSRPSTQTKSETQDSTADTEVGNEPTEVEAEQMESEPTLTPRQLQSDSKYVDPRLLTSDPESYLGQNVYIQGKALTVEQETGYTWVQVLAEVRNDSSTESIIAFITPPEKSLLSNDCYKFYGYVDDPTIMTLRLTGAEVNVPTIEVYAHAKKVDADFGCADP